MTLHLPAPSFRTMASWFSTVYFCSSPGEKVNCLVSSPSACSKHGNPMSNLPLWFGACLQFFTSTYQSIMALFDIFTHLHFDGIHPLPPFLLSRLLWVWPSELNLGLLTAAYQQLPYWRQPGSHSLVIPQAGVDPGESLPISDVNYVLHSSFIQLGSGKHLDSTPDKTVSFVFYLRVSVNFSDPSAGFTYSPLHFTGDSHVCTDWPFGGSMGNLSFWSLWGLITFIWPRFCWLFVIALENLSTF